MLNSWKWSPPADGVYRFEKNRSKQFWNAAYKLQFMLDVMIPMLCCLDTVWRSMYEIAENAIGSMGRV